MWLPIVDYADGYGFTYGARVSFVDTLGPRSRISVPAHVGRRTQGRSRSRSHLRARAVQPHRRGVVAQPPREPAFRDRRHAPRSAAARRARRHAVAAAGRWRAADQRRVRRHRRNVTSRRASMSSSTRARIRPFPAMPSTSIAGVEQLRFEGGRNVRAMDGGCPRLSSGWSDRSVLALRASSSQASDPLPAYEQALLGGTPTLRGYELRLSGRRQPGGCVRRSACAADLAAARGAFRRQGVRRRGHGLPVRREALRSALRSRQSAAACSSPPRSCALASTSPGRDARIERPALALRAWSRRSQSSTSPPGPGSALFSRPARLQGEASRSPAQDPLRRWYR